jgi:hypothetical protein
VKLPRKASERFKIARTLTGPSSSSRQTSGWESIDRPLSLVAKPMARHGSRGGSVGSSWWLAPRADFAVQLRKTARERRCLLCFDFSYRLRHDMSVLRRCGADKHLGTYAARPASAVCQRTSSSGFPLCRAVKTVGVGQLHTPEAQPQYRWVSGSVWRVLSHR